MKNALYKENVLFFAVICIFLSLLFRCRPFRKKVHGEKIDKGKLEDQKLIIKILFACQLQHLKI